MGSRARRKRGLTKYDPHLKLRGALFFLGMMRERDGRELLHKEEFVHCLGAFLAAARTVISALPRTIKGFDEASWLDGLPKDKGDLYRALVDIRDTEVHDGHADKIETHEQESAWLVLGRGNTLPAPHLIVLPPFVYDDGSTIAVKRYWFDIEGTRVPVVEQCERWVALLQEAVAGFVSAGLLPQP